MPFLKTGAKYLFDKKNKYKCINPKCNYKIKQKEQKVSKCPLCGFDLLIEK